MVKNMSEKGKKLRPLRIFLAILGVILVILLLNLLPTKKTYISKKSTEQTEQGESASNPASESAPKNDENSEEKTYFYLSGLLEEIEKQTEARLESLGVPEEEYKNISEYLSKDEIFELETKVSLAASLEEVWVEASLEEITEVRNIFNLDEDYDFSENSSKNPPSEYENLSDLLKEYEKTLTFTEDYDIMEI